MIKQLVGHNILVMTKYKNIINKILPVSLPDSFYTNYINNNILSSFIVQSVSSKHNYLLIDDINMFIQSGICIDQNISTNTKIIILGTLGITKNDIDIINNIFINISYLYINMLNEGPILEYKIHESYLNNIQIDNIIKTIEYKENENEYNENENEYNENEYNENENEYNENEYNENENEYNENENEYNENENEYNENENENEYNENKNEYNKTENEYNELEKIMIGCIPTDIWSIEQINIISPKIAQLLTILLTNTGERHIVYTKHPDIISDLIESILIDIKYKYKIIEVDDSIAYINAALTSWSSPNTNINKIDSSSFLLITSILLPYQLYNVSHIHFLEGVNYMKYKSFIDQIYKINLYNIPIGKLKIHFHISKSNNDIISFINPDIKKYENLSKRLGDEQYIFSSLLKKSKKLGYNIELGMIID
uniref:Uncharacterized protein n=1 Tax=Pithovirus LCPAC102 TaxID=2506587 RepID=A0A481Z387_9VIRU|nr:MAG: hypothetical protein LCPAC102_01290 [Pithovirus LCPAC102]